MTPNLLAAQVIPMSGTRRAVAWQSRSCRPLRRAQSETVLRELPGTEPTAVIDTELAVPDWPVLAAGIWAARVLRDCAGPVWWRGSLGAAEGRAAVTVIEADVAVVGAGSVGSMASWQLAARGLRVVGVDRFPVPGPFSAYAGESRVFRMVYAEGGHYTPLLQRARDLWRDLEAATGTSLLAVTGVVTIMDHDHPDHAALLRAGRERGLQFEVVTGEEARRRLPQHLIREGDVALFDPEGGYLRSEHAVFCALQLAQRHGATFLGNRQVSTLERRGDQWSVRTDQEEVRAPRVLIATGTGAGPVCAALGTHLAVLPQVLTWFPIADAALLVSQPEQVFIRSSRDAQFYGFPSMDGWTVKVAASIYLDEATSMASPLTWDPRHLDTVQSWVGTYLPALTPKPVRAVLCSDGYTVDETGLLGFVPGMDGVVVAVGFSGHGFKMASSLGAVVADLISEGTTATDVSFMDPARFLPPPHTVSALPLDAPVSRPEAS